MGSDAESLNFSLPVKRTAKQWAIQIGKYFGILCAAGVVAALVIYFTKDSTEPKTLAGGIPDDTHPVLFDGSIDAANPYKGPSGKELDNTWKDLYDINPFAAPGKDLKALHKTSIEVPTQPGRFFVSLAVFHQLHCLDMVRRYVHNDHYQMDGHDSSVPIVDHIDHCIDMIRQALMCHADTTLITWKGTFNRPEPDFNAEHQCKKFDKIRDWAKNHEVNMTDEFEKDPEALKRVLIEGIEQNAK
ncbi:hypothetical protein AJ79_06028 [Helicocarpus griseus UAMH5409]|uniref:Tat pathway signal sequence n=1 Tax=Helicocarpus griseus UAMH5409 TaxID=1447875 RepID=A0A2B7XHU1_9EURO|nr:hypothetical protein AJ79_06028 [Helicocarpus griseus UAMH5409]